MRSRARRPRTSSACEVPYSQAMLKRLIRLAVFAAIASAIATAVQTALKTDTDAAPQRADAGGSGSVDTWPEVPRNPDAA